MLHVWEPTACASMVTVINLERKGFFNKRLGQSACKSCCEPTESYSSNTKTEENASKSNVHIMLLVLMNNKVSKNKVLVNSDSMTTTKMKLSEHQTLSVK